MKANYDDSRTQAGKPAEGLWNSRC